MTSKRYRYGTGKAPMTTRRKMLVRFGGRGRFAVMRRSRPERLRRVSVSHDGASGRGSWEPSLEVGAFGGLSEWIMRAANAPQ